MKILILSQYYPPETGAPQNRLSSLAKTLCKLGCTVQILTALPNYPRREIFEEYKGRVYVKEQSANVTIFRSWLFVNNSTKAHYRLFNYFSFVFTSLWIGLLKIKKQDIIICESPPLFLGITALILKKIKDAKLVFNVSDLWPESAEKLGVITNRFLLKITYWLEGYIYNKSTMISCQTMGILKSISRRYPNSRTYLFNNGIDLNDFNVNVNGIRFREVMKIHEDDFVLLYAGVLGLAQGLETIIEAAEKLLSYKDIRLLIVGDGPEKDTLVRLSTRKNLKNLTFLSNREKKEIPEIVASCNAYIVPLKKNDLFLGAIPSKIFEPLTLGKPIILGINGEAREIFIETGKCGLFYEPENSFELTNCILTLYYDRNLAIKLGQNGQQFVNKFYNREVISNNFFKELRKLIF